MKFKSKTVLPGLAGAYGLVTGSSAGMGRCIAEFLVENGAFVGVNGRDQQRISTVVSGLELERPGSAMALPGDVSRLEVVKAIFEQFLKWSGGKLDFVILNAGYPLEDALWETPLHEMSDQQISAGFEKVRRVDLNSARFCTREALKVMTTQARGSLVYISSTPALTGYKGTPYTEAKAGILGLMRDVANEYAALNIRANALALGNIKSGWYNKLTDSKKSELAEEAPMKRWGEQAEVAGPAAFFLSDLAGFVTGQTLVVDGGKVVR